MDRRGRGASSDASGYELQRESEDVAAVLEVVAAGTGNPVAVWGHSFGADCAMGAANLTDRIGCLVLYEPGWGIPVPTTTIEEIEQRVATGDTEAAMLTVLTKVVGMTDEEVAFLRASPFVAQPTRRRTRDAPRAARRVGVGVSAWPIRRRHGTALILAGSASPRTQSEASRRAAAAIRNARIHVLEGHGHIAHRTDPAMVAAIIRDFAAS
jgi:pimeloyl-ACP methyl ester carboxylesterase